ncbi:histidine kinase [Flavihumibacter rivuli]|uniref:ligand-binding sensor domain-containing protein n=1 Tax=Flavihumibacter rivuli TaxID=2838156 RepID=UPI001BDF0F30|nr:sensor histidine kinase [Flavihumibacter rivuli]ULQ55892.1 histidine kinase [Flavihumibacter rivuli]
MLYRPLIIAALLLAFGFVRSFAQPLLFENYNSRNGLSQHNCISVTQDRDGFMWFATLDGLNRYDGHSFKVYLQQNEAGRKLPSNAILALNFDHANDLLWIGTTRGLCLYRPSGDSLARFSDFFPFAALLDSANVFKILSFAPHEWWVLTNSHGLVYLNTDRAEIRRYFVDNAPSNQITDLTIHNGRVMVATQQGVYELIPGKDSFRIEQRFKDYPFPQIRAIASYDNKLWVGAISSGCYLVEWDHDGREIVRPSDLVFGGIESFATGKQGELWIMTRGSGIIRYHAPTGRVQQAFQDQYDPRSPISNFGACVFTDKQGIVWIGASGGIIKYNPLRYQFLTINGASSRNASLTDNGVYCMYQCRDGVKLVGTQGKGLFKWDDRDNYFTSYPASAVVQKANNVIYSITEDEPGLIWAATCGGLMQLDRRTNKITYFPEKNKYHRLNKMYGILKLRHSDSLLLGTDDGLQVFSLQSLEWENRTRSISSKTIREGLAGFKRATYMLEEEDGIVWLCNESVGLARYHYLSQGIEAISKVNVLAKGVKHFIRYSGYLVLATNNGLVVYDDKNDRVIRQVLIRPKERSNVCHSVQKDRQGNFWVSTNYGLYKLDRHFKVIGEYNTGNGLGYVEFNPGSTLADKNGRLYFGGMDGITAFDPASIMATDFSPTPVITAISINNSNAQTKKHPNYIPELELTYRQNFLRFQFAATNYSNESNTRFSYRLRGLNDTWSVPSRNPEAIFTSLPPGDYTLEVRAANSDGKWSEKVKSMRVVIQPAFWETNLFRGVACLVFMALVTLLYQRRIAKVRQDAILKHQMAEIEIKGLHTQMNPHFIFNALNSIKEMIWKDDKRNASRYLSKFANLVRISLEQSRQPFITIRECVDHLEQYLQLEKLRFDDFQYKIELASDLDPDHTSIAPMLVQPLVENAIWHGLRSKSNDRRLMVRFFKRKGAIVCEVEDNGVGIAKSLQEKENRQSLHSSVGIANIRERLRVLNEKYRMNCSLRIADKSELSVQQGSGTVAVLELSG